MLTDGSTGKLIIALLLPVYADADKDAGEGIHIAPRIRRESLTKLGPATTVVQTAKRQG